MCMSFCEITLNELEKKTSKKSKIFPVLIDFLFNTGDNESEFKGGYDAIIKEINIAMMIND